MTPKTIGPWTVMSAEVRYDNRWITVTHHEVVTPTGTDGIYGTVHFKNLAIAIVPVDADGHTWLVGQHRFPFDEYSWEVPEGGGPLGVDPLESAARELVEETGLAADHWQALLEMDLSNSVSDERAIAYLAWGLRQGAAMPEPTEQLLLRRLPLAEACAMARSGAIRDALSVGALQAVRLAWLEGSLPETVMRAIGAPR
ncbi:MAG: NUDIX domain-containing protein [Alphaproteobacteria bacterium]